MNNFGKNIALWVIILLLLFALFNLFQQPSGRSAQSGIPYSTFLADVEGGQIETVTIKGRSISGVRKDGRSFSTYAPNDPNLIEKLDKTGVVIDAAPADDGSPSLLNILISWFPMLLLIGVWIFFMRQMQGGGGKAMGFGGVGEGEGLVYHWPDLALDHIGPDGL